MDERLEPGPPQGAIGWMPRLRLVRGRHGASRINGECMNRFARVLCGECRWAAVLHDPVEMERLADGKMHFLECRYRSPRSPPADGRQLYVARDSNVIRTGWPIVSSSDWCRHGEELDDIGEED